MATDACVNCCVLFSKEFANEDKCPKYLAPRWKEKIVQGVDECPDNVNVRDRIRVPHLVLHHLPLIQRYSHNVAGALVYHEPSRLTYQLKILKKYLSPLIPRRIPCMSRLFEKTKGASANWSNTSASWIFGHMNCWKLY